MLSLIISPTAKGTFNHAIVESGLSLIWSTKTAEAQSLDLLISLLIKDRKAKDEKGAKHIIGEMSEKEVNDYCY